ncbi:DUF2169 family type VI secretion system accessory protein [Chondromyces crocatus]|uniref:DUF2169 family type VI secretion system accessory protein n=1 Tax=Chondromyces crocatus TaxID=52 RepID=UPI0012E12C4D|nr:DUF2169 domain-containing protein [Chondromyces crocatus]
MVSVTMQCPFVASTLVWGPRPGEWLLTVGVKATFSLVAGQESVLSDVQVGMQDDTYWDDDPQASLRVPTDFVPYKPRAEVFLSGHAFAPGGVPVDELTAVLGVGALSKGLRLTGELAWGQGAPFRGAPFSRVALRHERATRVGEGGTPGSAPGFGPIAPRRRALQLQLSEEGLRWAYQLKGTPALAPGGFDPRFFNAAPLDQQVERLDPGVPLSLRNLHPRLPLLETRLPAVRPRAFRLDRAGTQPTEITLRCDTLCIDTDRALAMLTWRGVTGIMTSHALEVARVVVAAQPAGEALSYADLVQHARARRGRGAPSMSPQDVEARRVEHDVLTTSAPALTPSSAPLPFNPGAPSSGSLTPLRSSASSAQGAAWAERDPRQSSPPSAEGAARPGVAARRPEAGATQAPPLRSARGTLPFQIVRPLQGGPVVATPAERGAGPAEHGAEPAERGAEAEDEEDDEVVTLLGQSIIAPAPAAMMPPGWALAPVAPSWPSAAPSPALGTSSAADASSSVDTSSMAGAYASYTAPEPTGRDVGARITDASPTAPGPTGRDVEARATPGSAGADEAFVDIQAAIWAGRPIAEALSRHALDELSFRVSSDRLLRELSAEAQEGKSDRLLRLGAELRRRLASLDVAKEPR